MLAACATNAWAGPDVACFGHSTGNPEQIGAFFVSKCAGAFVTKDGAYQLEIDPAVAAAALLSEL